MTDFLARLFPDIVVRMDEFYSCTIETLIMLGVVGSMSFVLSLVLAIVLVVTASGGLAPNRIVYQVLDKFINLMRSIPFIILVTMMIPLTRFVMGTAIDLRGAIFPLIVGITPFFVRQLESALMGIDPGMVEASVSMGFTRWQIIWKVFLRESISRITKVTTITLVHLLSFTAVIGVVGGGGLGDFAIRYGFQRYMFDASVAVVLVFLVFIYIIETVGKLIIASTTHG
ncbi:MAG: ABC transporter permease [Bifidobacterium minimum]|jgi:D-methionine transport system permease protein|nr:ABC transporter permease [Bifidobacterium minimum]